MRRIGQKQQKVWPKKVKSQEQRDRKSIKQREPMGRRNCVESDWGERKRTKCGNNQSQPKPTTIAPKQSLRTQTIPFICLFKQKFQSAENWEGICPICSSFSKVQIFQLFFKKNPQTDHLGVGLLGLAQSLLMKAMEDHPREQIQPKLILCNDNFESHKLDLILSNPKFPHRPYEFAQFPILCSGP